MKKNIVIGDIFMVKISENKIKFFQLIAFDLTQLNSEVIRVFKKAYHSHLIPEFSELIKEEVDFYAHCIIKFGIKQNYWEKVGNISDVGFIDNIIFKDTNDYGYKVGNDPILVSNKWYIWKINDDDFTRVGMIEGENRKAEIGIVINPKSIVHRMITGKYDFIYPD